MHKKINDNSESKISISTKKSNKEESIPENTIAFKDCKAEYMKGV